MLSLSNVKAYLASKTMQVTTACVALGVLILTGLMLLGVAVMLRILLIILLLVLFMLCIYWVWQRYSHPSQQQQIKRAMRERLHQLKQLLKRQQAPAGAMLHEAPRFLLLSESQPDITRFMRCSGLHLVDVPGETDDEALCHWQCCDEGMFIGVDPRLLAQAEDQAWNGLMKSLKSSKPHRPLDAIILLLPLSQWTADMQHISAQIRTRLDQAFDQLGFVIPIHVVISQSEQLSGFTSFYHQADARLAPVICLDNQQQFDHASAQLDHKMHERLLSVVHAGKSSIQSSKDRPLSTIKSRQYAFDVMMFPEIMRQSVEGVLKLLRRMVQSSRYQHAMSSCHVYWVSDENEQQPLFVAEAMNHVIQQRTPLKPTASHLRKANRLLLLKRSASALAVTGGMAALLNAWFCNTDLLATGERIAIDLQQSVLQKRHDAEQMLRLDAAGCHLHRIKFKDSDLSWYQRLGLFRGQEQIEAFEHLLNQAMYHDFYLKMMVTLENQLRTTHQNWHSMSQDLSARGAYYSDLKTYLMLHYPKQLDIDMASQHLSRRWLLQLGDGDKQMFQRLTRHYLESMTDWDHVNYARIPKVNQPLIQAVRQDLSSAKGMHHPFAEFIWLQTEQQGDGLLPQMAGEQSAALWQGVKPLSLLYTPDHYQQWVKPAFVAMSHYAPASDWVLHASPAALSGTIASETQLTKASQQWLTELEKRYWSEYLRHWLSVVEGLRLIDFNDLDDAAAQLRQLVEQPLAGKHLYAYIAQHIDIKQYMSNKSWAELPAGLRQRYEELSGLMSDSAQLEPYWQQINALQVSLEQLSMNDPGNKSIHQQVERMLQGQDNDNEFSKTVKVIEKITHQLHQADERKAVYQLLMRPVEESYRALLNKTFHDVDLKWQTLVYEEYQHTLSSHFPFNHQGVDASMEDINHFFKTEQGVLAQFVQNELAPFVVWNGKQYIARSWHGITAPISTEALDWLTRARVFSESSMSSGALQVDYSIYPYPVAGIKEVMLMSEGQSYAYRNGPQEWAHFHWPGQQNTDHETILRITRGIDDAQGTLSQQGEWGLLHLLNKARLVQKNNRSYRLEFHMALGKTVQILLKENNRDDPLSFLLFEPKPMPASLAQHI